MTRTIQATDLAVYHSAITNIKDFKLPVSQSFALAKLAKRLEREMQDFNAYRLEVQEDYYMKNEDGGILFESSDSLVPKMKPEWAEKAKEILELKVEVEVSNTLSLELLEKIEGSISTQDAYVICKLLDEPDDL